MIKRYLILLSAAIIIGGSALGQSKVGTTAANFLTIPVGPRASGMGGAFVAIANDVTAAFWNTGGLPRLNDNQFIVTHADWLVGTSLNWVGISFKLDEDNAVAISVNQLYYGTEEITTAMEPQGTGQLWDAQDIAVGLSYARNLTDRFSIGGTFKYINQRVWSESATAFALDVGLLFTTQYNGLRIGMNIANFGTEMQLDGKDLLQPVDVDPAHTGNNKNIAGTLQTDSWPLPLTFTVGLGMDPVKTENWKWTIGTDAIYPNNQTGYLNLGTELSWKNIVFVRAGYNSLFKEAAEQNLSAGVGFQYDLGIFKAAVDYSYMNFGVFSQISRYAISVKF